MLLRISPALNEEDVVDNVLWNFKFRSPFFSPSNASDEDSVIMREKVMPSPLWCGLEMDFSNAFCTIILVRVTVLSSESQGFYLGM